VVGCGGGIGSVQVAGAGPVLFSVSATEACVAMPCRAHQRTNVARGCPGGGGRAPASGGGSSGCGSGQPAAALSPQVPARGGPALPGPPVRHVLGWWG